MSSPKKLDAISKHSLTSTQDEVHAILKNYGITGVEAISLREQIPSTTLPKGYSLILPSTYDI